MTRGKLRERLRGILTRADERHREHLAALRASASRAPRDEGRRAQAQRGAVMTRARRARGGPRRRRRTIQNPPGPGGLEDERGWLSEPTRPGGTPRRGRAHSKSLRDTTVSQSGRIAKR